VRESSDEKPHAGTVQTLEERERIFAGRLEGGEGDETAKPMPTALARARRRPPPRPKARREHGRDLSAWGLISRPEARRSRRNDGAARAAAEALDADGVGEGREVAADPAMPPEALRATVWAGWPIILEDETAGC
jgi:hypothetical protein